DAGQHELQTNPGQETHFEEENAEGAENPDAVQYVPVGQHAGVVETGGEDRDQTDRYARFDRHWRKTLHARGGRVLPWKRADFALEGSDRHALWTETYADNY